LVKTIEADVRAEVTKEVRKLMESEERIKELESQLETITTERDELKEAKEQAEREKVKAEAQALIKEAIDKAELPQAAKNRLMKRFEEAESVDGVEEAIQAEKDYIAELAESGKVKNLGATQPDTGKSKEALKESFKKIYMSQGKTEEEAEKLAETAAKGR